jgi:hypothetical protein
MGDLAGRVAEIEPIDRLFGQRRRLDPVAVHPLPGRWKAAESVEAAGIDRLVAPWRGRRQTGPSLLDVRARHHPVEEEPRAPIPEQAFGKTNKGAVYLMLRDRDPQTIDVGSDHRLAPRSRVASVTTRSQ